LVEKYISHPLIREESIEARIYQQVVYAKAVKANTLFVAPTALGKTILCIMVAAHRLDRVGGKVLMLAPTRPLVLQHSKSFRKFTKLPNERIGDVSGTTQPIEREQIWPELKIAVATPQVVENDLRTGRLRLEDYSIIIFDEAHRATGNYAYVSIAKTYREQCSDPLVLGLTASPGNSEDVIREVCENLGVTNIEVKSDDDPDVRPYINPVEIEWKIVPLPKPILRLARDMRSYLDERFNNLRQVGLIRSDYSTRKDLLEAGKILGMGVDRFTETFRKPNFIYYKSLMDYATALKAEHALELIETQGIGQALEYLEHMADEAQVKGSPRSTKSFVRDPRIRAIAASMRRLRDEGIDHPKVGQMERFVRDELEGNPDSGIIIFTNYRNTVGQMVERLSKIPGVRVTRFVGQASRRSRGLSQKEQAQILEHFRSGKYNVLVATSVAEEGLDIAEVQMVLFYDCTPSAIRNIQRRGRTGRKGAGRVVIMITENTREEGYHWAGQSREKRMRNILRKIDGDIKNRQLKLDGFV
jgi:Fanconi anemia group M protein